ncbi:hypothetical protein QVD17_32167 [Tagetes erecta]|uniref:Uncharacterized protein n=1 Tax=Tagetes erecta TaxID=13708 RepID=A0AAD8K7H5_TARER|nr:hypothetical protein QVD17_32167 [Tagetes erecta]
MSTFLSNPVSKSCMYDLTIKIMYVQSDYDIAPASLSAFSSDQKLSFPHNTRPVSLSDPSYIILKDLTPICRTIVDRVYGSVCACIGFE